MQDRLLRATRLWRGRPFDFAQVKESAKPPWKYGFLVVAAKSLDKTLFLYTDGTVLP
jgi:hypothetical protein